MVKNNTQECFLYPERSRDKKSYLSRCKCPGWVQGMRSRRTWHAGTGLSRWRLDEETKMLRQQFSLKYAVAQNSRKPRQREKRECREKRFYWAKTKIALHVRFETPCIFQSPSEKQQREIIELYHVWDQKLSQQLIYFCKSNSTPH